MLVIALGFIVGLITALTGAGGGILAVPLLIFVTGLTVAQAGPVGLLAVGMSAALGATLGLRAGTVRYRAALLMAAAGVLCSPIGIWLASQFNEDVMSALFSTMLMFVAYRIFKQAHHDSVLEQNKETEHSLPCNLDADKKRLVWTKPCGRALAMFGACTGLLSGLLGVGGGFVIVPALQRYTNLTMESVVATSLAVIALVSISGVVASTLHGEMNWSVALPFCGGALVGMVSGRLISKRLEGPQLQTAFAMVAALVALGMQGKILFHFL